MNNKKPVYTPCKRKTDMVWGIWTKYIHLVMWSVINLLGLLDRSLAEPEVRKNYYLASSQEDWAAQTPAGNVSDQMTL